MPGTEIFLNAKFKGESKLISADSSTKFSDFVDQILTMWNHLEFPHISFRYSVGSINNCVLSGENDLKNLLVICDHISCKIVDVTISCSGSSSVLPPKSSQHPSSTFDNFQSVENTDHMKTPTKYAGIQTPSAQKNVEFGSSCKSSKVQSKVPKKRSLCVEEDELYLMDQLPTFDICPAVVKVPLLSDGWVDIMKDGVDSVFKGDASAFRQELVKYSVRLRFNFNYVRNDSKYIHARCLHESSFGCNWFIKARCKPLCCAFVIYKANLYHKCLGKAVYVDKHNRFSPKLIGNLVGNYVKSDPSMGGKQIVEHLRIHYGIDIPYYKGFRTTEEANTTLYGCYNDSYDDLRWYCQAVQRTNPGSVVKLETDSVSNEFIRVFFAFKACVDGFRHCRPMLFVDGTFMTGRSKGVLLTATAKDGNNGLFPVAFAVVSAENTNNWEWFLSLVRDYCTHPKEVLYVSDRNCGLLAAFPLVFEKPLHFFCLFHLMLNLKGRFSGGKANNKRGKMVELFRDCAYAPNQRLFEEKIALFREAGGCKAEKWLSDLPVEKWALAFTPIDTRYGEMTSNAAESFKYILKAARCLPITRMIDHIRGEIGRWHFERRTTSSKWDNALCPVKQAEWFWACDYYRSWKITQTGISEFTVGSNPSVVVNLQSRTCSCSQWQIGGFPCKHACVVINNHGILFLDFVDEYFLSEAYRSCYKDDIHPVPETEMFEINASSTAARILPPTLNRMPGRPKKKRVKSFGEH